MANKIGCRNIICFFQTVQYIQQTIDLCIRKCFKSIIINFNTNAAAVDIGSISPFAYTCMMCPQQVIQHMMHRSIFANNIMRTYLCTG